MKQFISLVISFTTIITATSAQGKNYDTLQTSGANNNLQSGFYFAVPDTSNSGGFKVYNKNEYYFLSSTPIVTLVDFDTIYKEFMPNLNNHVLIFKFSKVGTRNWFEFTKRYQNQQTGLVINNELVYVATIASPIESGVSWLAGGHSEKVIDNFKILFDKEIKKVRN
jgi:preprotein translocase subunit SecD